MENAFMDPEEIHSESEKKRRGAEGPGEDGQAKEEGSQEASELADRAMEKRDSDESGTPQSLF